MSDSIGEIYDKHAQTVYKFLLAQTHDPDLSEDLTEDTFLQAIKSIKRFDGSCKLSVWLCQIAKHLWYKELERRKKHGLSLEIPEDTAAPPENVLHSERNDLYMAIHKLSDMQREIVLLRLSGEFGFAEIGEIIGKSESFARTTFYRAKEEIRRIINAQS
ncbi:MAG: sigma-70 family RNA polymerase sigma factor [Ruminococcus sp.]|nr:sigma-70 family RNA polymerase sigma factor [Ruminococcus sp.]